MEHKDSDDNIIATENDKVVYQCRQDPFASMCKHYWPDSVKGSEAWKVYDKRHKDLPPVATKLIECVPWRNDKVKWMAEDMACVGEYVYKCRAVSGPDWCNIHEPETAFGFMAWELMAGLPYPDEKIYDK